MTMLKSFERSESTSQLSMSCIARAFSQTCNIPPGTVTPNCLTPPPPASSSCGFSYRNPSYTG